MTRLISYFLAAVAALWGDVLEVGIANLQQLAAPAAALGALNAGDSAGAQQIDAKLGELDRLALVDRSVQARLVAKRVAVFVAGVLAMAGARVFSFSSDATLQAAGAVASLGGAFAGAMGCLCTALAESAALDERVRNCAGMLAGSRRARWRRSGQRGRTEVTDEGDELEGMGAE